MSTPGGGNVIGSAFVQILSDTRGFAGSVMRGVRPARAVADKEGQAAGEQYGEGFKRGADGRLRDAKGKFVPDGGGAGGTFNKGGKKRGKEFGDGFASEVVKAGGFAAKGLALAVGAGLAGLATQAAVGGVVALVAALAPLAGALGAIPAVTAAAAAGLGVLLLGFNGVGDAITNLGDPEKFSDAIATLSPSARDAALALRDIKPALDDLQLAVQDRLFQGVDQSLRELAGATLPTLRKGLTGIADQFNENGRAVAAFAGESESVSVLDELFQQISQSIDLLSEALRPALVAIRDVVGVGGTFLPQLATAIGDVATRFATFLSDAAGDGRLAAAINAAGVAFGQLGDIIGAAGSIVLSVVQAGQAVGGGLLANIAGGLQGVADFLNSPAGQGALAQFFAATSEAIQALLPVLTGVLGAVANLAPILSGLATGIGPGLVVALQGLADGFANILPSAEPLGAALAGILIELTPLLPALGTLIGELAISLTNALIVVTPLIASLVAEVIRNQAPLLDLVRSVGNLVTGLNDLARPLGVVVGILPQLGFISSDAINPVEVLSSQLRALGDAAGFVAGAIGAVAGAAARLPGAGSDISRTAVSAMKNNPNRRTSIDDQRDGALAARAADAAKRAIPAFRTVGAAAATQFTRGVAGGAQRASDAAAELARAAVARLREQATGIREVVAELERTAAKYDAFRQQAVASARQFASLQQIFTDPSRASAGSFVEGLQTRLAALSLFARNLKALAARGLDRSVLEQIGSLGPEQGRAFAAALSQGSAADLARINALTRQVNAVSGTVGANATAAAFGNLPAQNLAELKKQTAVLERLEKAINAGPAKTGKAASTALTTAARTSDTRARTAVAS